MVRGAVEATDWDWEWVGVLAKVPAGETDRDWGKAGDRAPALVKRLRACPSEHFLSSNICLLQCSSGPPGSFHNAIRTTRLSLRSSRRSSVRRMKSDRRRRRLTTYLCPDIRMAQHLQTVGLLLHIPPILHHSTPRTFAALKLPA